ncbi:MAG: hypothetical protein KAJ93_01055 [Methanosarcinales archaeon]|nr:hypothetical protein [Methanosarcinales archaeon]
MKPECELIGTDGNIFTIMGKVQRVLRAEGMKVEAKEYVNKVMACGSYDEALVITMEYVEVV